MSKLIRIVGSGGGKGGSGETFEADDNLFSRQSAAFVDAIAEGPIKGLVYGDASIIVDEQRLRNVNQSTGLVSSKTNFKNFIMTTTNGDATQTPDPEFFSDFPSAAITEEKNSAVLLESEPQFFTISSGTFEKQNADYLKVTISTNGMQAITKKGDNKGDINETKVFFKIDLVFTNNSGAVITRNKFNTGFVGKVGGKYAHTFGFNIENEKAQEGVLDWAIKVTKLSASPNSTDSTEVSNDIFVDSIEATIADKLEYPYTAYVAGTIDAEQFNTIPARGYEIDGKIISIPSNMFPCDYNGRKITVSDASGISVGTVLSQTLSINSLTASGNADDGYVATVTLGANHQIPTAETFEVTIAGVTNDTDFYNGTFTATSSGSTTFTYPLASPFNESTGEFKTLGNTTASGTKTAALFSGGIVDKIDGTTLYVRNVAAQKQVVGGALTFSGGSTSVTGLSGQIFIPANYRRHVTTGVMQSTEQDWDGNFYESWCNNPAWVYNDLITNKIYGLGNYLGQAQINKWELFQIGRYCDELVPAGVDAADFLALFTTDDSNYLPSGATGTHEPRFSANLVINGKQEAYKVLNDVVGIFRGMTYWLNGQALVVQDSEKDPVYQFTNANVIDGTFAYEGTPLKTRINACQVSWNDPNDYYRQRVEHVELEETLQRDDEFVKPDSVTAFGCTSRGQARRLGKWRLLTNNLHTNTISFSTSINAAFLKPGDIFQVIDQHKDGKSWGGRSLTGSTTTAIKVDRKPTGFGDTSVESGYAVGDYRLTLSFTGYVALLAQDTARIGNADYVRGQEVPNIANEEEAATKKDDDGNFVFIQWVPYTHTETQTLNSVSNNGTTLTVAQAFDSAPTADSIWILSRPSLQTGKTKHEAKLFRALSIVEEEAGKFEITGLEYNATKFDAVDKNEAITEYRTINLPNSFDAVPVVNNLHAFGTVEPRIGDDTYVNVLNITWDNAKNSDGSLYNFVRGYEVEYSKDNVKFINAGMFHGTEADIVGAISGTYYFRVYVISLQGKKGAAATLTKTVDFSSLMAIDGTVGNGDMVIPLTGRINSEFNINTSSGLVSFTPAANFTYTNNIADITVTNQANLDFSGLANEGVGYVYFDHSASQFKAIAHDATSDQFFPVGDDVFQSGTGTITSVGNTRSLTGNSTNWSSALQKHDIIKITKDSVDYYPRIDEVLNDTGAVLRKNLSPVLSANAYSIPKFQAEFASSLGGLRDTIMGRVTKSADGNSYELVQFGTSNGEAGFSVFGTNENHGFTAPSNGQVSQSDYSAYTNDYTVSKGAVAYTFASSGTAANTYNVTVSAVTGFASTDLVNITSNSNQARITIDDNSMDSITAATATLAFTENATGNTISTRVISFTKQSAGTDGVDGTDGSDGIDAVAIKLVPSSQAIVYDINDNESTVITFTTETQNAPASPYYQFLVDGTSKQNSTTSTFTLAESDEPAAGAIKKIQVRLRDGGPSATIKATDTLTVYGVKEGSDAYTVILSNDAHTLPTTNAGAVTYTGSGTDIRVFKGNDALIHITSGTPSAGQFKATTGTATNITANSSGFSTVTKTTTNDTARIGVHSNCSADTAEIEYSVNCENVATIIKAQTFSKSKQGADGTDGVDGADGSDGSDGTNARAVDLTPGTNVFTYTAAGASPSPSTTTVTATAHNTNGTVYYRFFLNNSSVQHTTSNTYTYTPQASISNMPDQVEVEIREGSVSNSVLARDHITLGGIRPGADGTDGVDGGDGVDALSTFYSNQAHTVPVTNTGTETWTGSGGNLSIFDGTTELVLNSNSQSTSYPGSNGRYNLNITKVSGDTLTEGAITGSGSAGATIGDFSGNLTQATQYEISAFVKAADGTQYNPKFKISFAPSNQGADGLDGADGSDGSDGVDARAVDLTAGTSIFTYNAAGSSPSPSSTTITATGKNTSGTVYYKFFKDDTEVQHTTSNTYAYTPPSAIGSLPDEIEVELREGSKTSAILARDHITIGGIRPGADGTDGTNAQNQKVVFIFKKNDTNVGGTASNQTFADPTNGLESGWSLTQPALSANGDQVYMSQRLFTSDGASPQEASWSTPVVVARRTDGTDGTDGDDGTNGQSVKFVQLFKLNDSSFGTSTAGSYTNPTSGAEAGWSTTVPALSSNNDKVYMVSRTFTSDGNSPQTSSWTSPVIVAQRVDGTDGVDGVDGGDGVDAITTFYSNQAHTVPVTNTGTETWTGSGGLLNVFSGTTELVLDSNSQSTAYPTSNGRYRINITKVSGNTLTEGAITGSGSVGATIGDFSGNLTGATQYEISIFAKDPAGNQYNPKFKISFAPSFQGSDGQDGEDGDDGEDGNPGLRTVQGYLFYEKTSSGAPGAPSGNTYTFSTGVVSGSGINDNGTTNVWRNSPRTADATSSNTFYTVRYYGTESTANSSTISVSYSNVVKSFSFEGVVTFSGGTITDGTNSFDTDSVLVPGDLGASGTTTIDGGRITTGTLVADRIGANSIDIAGKSIAGSIGTIDGVVADSSTIYEYGELYRQAFNTAGRPHIADTTQTTGSDSGESGSIPAITAGSSILGNSPIMTFTFTTHDWGNGTRRHLFLFAGTISGSSAGGTPEGALALVVRKTTSSTDYTSLTGYAGTTAKTMNGTTAVIGGHTLSLGLDLDSNSQYYVWLFGAVDDTSNEKLTDASLTVLGLNN